MKILGGRSVADEILAATKIRITEESLQPALAVILVGADPASEIYVNLKGKAAQEIGISFQLIKFSAEVSEQEVLEKIIELNGDEKVSGIIVQLPLPEKFQMQKIINSIDSRKDVDGFHPENEKSFLSGGASFWPVFPHAIIRLLESSREKLEDKKAVVVANSQRFGEVMVAALRKKNISGKYILAGELKNDSLQEADIVITACGTPGKITGGMVKNGAIIIDGGITRSGDKTVGDVDFESVHNMAGFISPVPGGVGPVTIACLLENVYLAAKKAKD